MIVLCFSTARRESFEALKKTWLPLVKTLPYSNKDDAAFMKPFVLLGLQTDLRERGSGGQEVVTDGEGAAFAEESEALGYFECSLLGDEDHLESIREKLLKTAKE